MLALSTPGLSCGRPLARSILKGARVPVYIPTNRGTGVQRFPPVFALCRLYSSTPVMFGDARKPRGPPRTQSTNNRAPSARASARAEAGAGIVANEAVVAAVGGAGSQVRVIGDKNENLGLMAVQEAVLAAKAKGVDLLLVNAKGAPPICKLGSVQAMIKAQREKAKAAAEAERGRKLKEIRLTARTDEHDLSVKAGRVVEFLRQGHPVKVSVSFTLAAWASEEPARREVMAKLCRAVAEAGAGFPEMTSIQGASSVLSAQFQPTSSPKPAGEWEKVLRVFASPLRPQQGEAGGEGGSKKASEEGIQATVKAALDGQVSKVTAATVLPPEEILRRYARRAVGPRAHAGVKAGEPMEDDEEDDRADNRPRGGPRGRRGGRRPGSGGDDDGGGGLGGGGQEDDLFDKGEKLIDLKVAGRRKGKAAHKR